LNQSVQGSRALRFAGMCENYLLSLHMELI
jgi:hypothetical protein